MDEEELTRLADLAAAATQGPWEVGDRLHVQGASHCTCADRYGPLVWQGRDNINGTMMDTHIHRRPEPLPSYDTSIYAVPSPQDQVCVALSTGEYVEIAPEDAEFIAAAREAVPALVAEVRRLRAERDRAREDCGHQKAMRAHVEEERDLFLKRYRDASDRCVRLAATVERVRKLADEYARGRGGPTARRIRAALDEGNES